MTGSGSPPPSASSGPGLPGAEAGLRGWVLYDGACGFCRRWVPRWGPTLRKRGLGVAPLQSPWVGDVLRLPPADLLRDIRLVLRDGSHLQGADVYRYAMRRIWWAYPAYLLAVAPGLARVFDGAYRLVATHRHRISGVCGLEGAPSAAPGEPPAPGPGLGRRGPGDPGRD